MTSTVATEIIKQAMKQAIISKKQAVKGASAEAQLGLVCMLGSMLSSSNDKKNVSENLMQKKDFSSKAQRKKNHGLVSFRELTKKSKESGLVSFRELTKKSKESGLVSFRELTKKSKESGMKFTEKTKVAAAVTAAANIPDETGYDSDFDVEVVHCKLRGDECSTTDTGDFSSESDGGFSDSSFSASEHSSDDDGEKDDDCSTLDGHTDTEDEWSDADDDDEAEVVVNVAQWRGVAVSMASVFRAVTIEDEEEWAEDEADEEEEEREPIEVRNWENVGARMAHVLEAAAAEEEFEE